MQQAILETFCFWIKRQVLLVFPPPAFFRFWIQIWYYSYSSPFANMKHQTREKYEKKGREIGPHIVGPLTSQQLQSSQACFFIPLPPVNEYLMNVLMQMRNTGLRGILDNSQGWELSENAAAIPHHIGLFKHSLRIMFCFKWGTLSMMFLESYQF